MAPWGPEWFPPMPLFLLRDGSIRRCSVVPDNLVLIPYHDRYHRRIHAVGDANSERLLLESQPPRRSSRPGRARRMPPPEEGIAA